MAYYSSGKKGFLEAIAQFLSPLDLDLREKSQRMLSGLIAIITAVWVGIMLFREIAVPIKGLTGFISNITQRGDFSQNFTIPVPVPEFPVAIVIGVSAMAIVMAAGFAIFRRRVHRAS